MTTTYISIDVATRSLALGAYEMKSFNHFERYDDPIQFNDYMNSLIIPIKMNVVDINSGCKTKDTSISEKAIALKQALTSFDNSIHEYISKAQSVCVLVEYQMNANHGANAIFNMIVYHYSGKYPIEVMKPSWKNTIALHPKLTLSEFLGQCSSNYSANKMHTRCNMLYLLTMIDQMDMIKDIAKKNQDDIADTLMQALAFHKKSCK